ncbi:MAG: hypothetical protein V1912_06005 [bacterium]
MKKMILVWTAILMVTAFQPAQAINREWSAVLGFLGGYMVANGGLSQRAYSCEPVVVAPPVVYERVMVQEPEAMGYYECQPQQVWVPGWWSSVRTPCGYVRRTWNPGYYQVQYVQVWVSDGPRHGHRGHHGRRGRW